jgi:hypothetical protein
MHQATSELVEFVMVCLNIYLPSYHVPLSQWNVGISRIFITRPADGGAPGASVQGVHASPATLFRCVCRDKHRPRLIKAYLDFNKACRRSSSHFSLMYYL